MLDSAAIVPSLYVLSFIHCLEGTATQNIQVESRRFTINSPLNRTMNSALQNTPTSWGPLNPSTCRIWQRPYSMEEQDHPNENMITKLSMVSAIVLCNRNTNEAEVSFASRWIWKSCLIFVLFRRLSSRRKEMVERADLYHIGDLSTSTWRSTLSWRARVTKTETSQYNAKHSSFSCPHRTRRTGHFDMI